MSMLTAPPAALRMQTQINRCKFHQDHGHSAWQEQNTNQYAASRIMDTHVNPPHDFGCKSQCKSAMYSDKAAKTRNNASTKQSEKEKTENNPT